MKANELGSLLLKHEDDVRSYAAATTAAHLSEIFEAIWSQIRAANLTSGQPRGSASAEERHLSFLEIRTFVFGNV